jgi:RsiW-degrading membrane proteinase PrsW (M82 family)
VLVVLRDLTWIAYAVAAVVFVWVAVLAWRRRAHNQTVAVSLGVVMLGLVCRLWPTPLLCRPSAN